MHKPPVIAIFDIGKTNKKLFLFNEDYKIVFEESAKFVETVDEDGDACENLESLKSFVLESLQAVIEKNEFDIRAINFSTYGASFVYVNEEGVPIAPLYNYLKPYDEALKKQFYDTYDGEDEFSTTTASPVLGNLNSGMQLYRIKYERPSLFAKIKYALHLPQYMSHIFSGEFYTDITSIGCHTNLWNFTTNEYHEWIYKEHVDHLMAPIKFITEIVSPRIANANYVVGIGVHDSSAALIPYLLNFSEPFVLISSGTWCISLNPFNQAPLTPNELKQDCLSYMQYTGRPIKASRLFAGYEHGEESARIASYFNKDENFYQDIDYDVTTVFFLKKGKNYTTDEFSSRDLSLYENCEQAYHQLMIDIIEKQVASTNLVIGETGVKRIFVDGGFSSNQIYMNLLANAYIDREIYAAMIPQATALGAALAIHDAWNGKRIPNDIIQLQFFRNHASLK